MNQYPNGILNEGIANLRHKCKNFKLNGGVLSEDLCFKLKGGTNRIFFFYCAMYTCIKSHLGRHKTTNF